MIDKSREFETTAEKIAYHTGWMDGLKTAEIIRDRIEARFKKPRGDRG